MRTIPCAEEDNLLGDLLGRGSGESHGGFQEGGARITLIDLLFAWKGNILC
ncbi:hypothetical protein [Sutcliffiella rhizosphaerae]|uniref:hypothetical protein n=1 Tax=Sutcliffiella rhizosphaerae TaxID=2880967 RepID=UPI001E6389C5|nr:hypothetical protein [Sutcliffiella rhizosphaerae]